MTSNMPFSQVPPGSCFEYQGVICLRTLGAAGGAIILSQPEIAYLRARPGNETVKAWLEPEFRPVGLPVSAPVGKRKETLVRVGALIVLRLPLPRQALCLKSDSGFGADHPKMDYIDVKAGNSVDIAIGPYIDRVFPEWKVFAAKDGQQITICAHGAG